MVVARESVKGLVEADEEEELLLQQAVLDYKKETLADFQIQKTTNGLFLFTNLKTVSRMTGNFRHCGLSHYLQKRLRFCTYVAYGVAPELSTAKAVPLRRSARAFTAKRFMLWWRILLWVRSCPRQSRLNRCPLTRI